MPLRTRSLPVLRRTALGLSALVLLLAASLPAEAEIFPSQLPQLRGDTFAAELLVDDGNGTVRNLAALWNFQDDAVSLYLHEPATGELSNLYSSAATVVSDNGTWTVDARDANLFFTVTRDAGGTVRVDGNDTPMVLLGATQTLAPGDAQAFEAALPQVTLSLSCLRCLPFIWDCCQCCFCVHRALGIPKILDVLCCLFSCFSPLPWL